MLNNNRLYGAVLDMVQTGVISARVGVFSSVVPGVVTSGQGDVVLIWLIVMLKWKGTVAGIEMNVAVKTNRRAFVWNNFGCNSPAAYRDRAHLSGYLTAKIFVNLNKMAGADCNCLTT